MVLSFQQYNLLEYQAKKDPILGTENNKTLRVREITNQLGYTEELDMLKSMIEFEETITSQPSDLDDYIDQFKKWSKTNEDLGVAMSGASSGMGAVVTSTPSAVSGETGGGYNVGDSFGHGGIVGSGDVSGGAWVYNKQNSKEWLREPATKKKSKSKRKERTKKFTSLQSYKKSKMS